MSERNLAHTCGWSIKEALFKWYGLGGIDFCKQLNIHSIKFNMETRCYTGEAGVLKDLGYTLKFEGRVLLGQCITVVVSRY